MGRNLPGASPILPAPAEEIRGQKLSRVEFVHRDDLVIL